MAAPQRVMQRRFREAAAAEFPKCLEQSIPDGPVAITLDENGFVDESGDEMAEIIGGELVGADSLCGCQLEAARENGQRSPQLPLGVCAQLVAPSDAVRHAVVPA